MTLMTLIVMTVNSNDFTKNWFSMMYDKIAFILNNVQVIQN